MKTFVTKEFMQSSAERIRGIEKELERIRKEKNKSFEGDTNAWHDNFAYESLIREEKLTEDKLFKAVREMDSYRVFSDVIPDNPRIVGMYCWVKVLEENLANLRQQEKTIGLVPLGGEDYKNKIYSYNAPVVLPLMGAKVGEVRTVKIPIGTFKLTVLDIQKMR